MRASQRLNTEIPNTFVFKNETSLYYPIPILYLPAAQIADPHAINKMGLPPHTRENVPTFPKYTVLHSSTPSIKHQRKWGIGRAVSLNHS